MDTIMPRVLAAHIFLTPAGYPNSQVGTCVCGIMPINSTRAEHVRHLQDISRPNRDGIPA